MLLQRYFHQKGFALKTTCPPQLAALGAILLSAKATVRPGSVNVAAIDPTKLLKYAAHKFAVEQVFDIELKMFSVLEMGCDLTFARDDLYSMIQTSVKHI